MTKDKARELAKRFGVRMCDENGNTHDEELYCLGLDDIIEMAKALAQPEQEPDDGYCKVCDGWKCAAKAGCVAFSNPPPQRTWVGLTDEEARQIREEANLSFQPEETRQKIVQELVESKLKEKNI